MTILVVWCTEPVGEQTDHWEAVGDMTEAKIKYEALCEREDVYSASIVGVLESEDYSTFTLPELPAVDLRVLQAFLLLPKGLRARFMDAMPPTTNDNLALAMELMEKA